jgi:hypothetical protein
MFLLVFLGAAFPFIALGMDENSVSQACGVCGKGCTGSRNVRFIRAFTNDDGVVNDSHKDRWDNGLDPGYDKNVARCEASIERSDLVWVRVTNAYPSYTCRFWVKVRNTGCESLRCRAPVTHAPAELTVRDETPCRCSTLRRNETAYYEFTVHVEQSAAQNAEYEFDIDLGFTSTCGSPCGH